MNTEQTSKIFFTIPVKLMNVNCNRHFRLCTVMDKNDVRTNNFFMFSFCGNKVSILTLYSPHILLLFFRNYILLMNYQRSIGVVES